MATSLRAHSTTSGRAALLAVIAAVLLAAGCSSDDDASPTTTAKDTTTTTEAADDGAEDPDALALAESINITIDDFAKVDLRVGKVLAAERIPRKDKLLKLSVDLGEAGGPRTIIAGIAPAFPDLAALVGHQVVVVANLAPRDFGKGLVSHGMLLAASSPESLSLATFGREYPAGTRVK